MLELAAEPSSGLRWSPTRIIFLWVWHFYDTPDQFLAPNSPNFQPILAFEESLESCWPGEHGRVEKIRIRHPNQK